LLAALVAQPAGIRAAVAAAAAGDATAAAAELERRGHALVASATGLRLRCAGQHFDPARFEAARRGALGAPLEVWETASSTNDLARAGAEGGAAAGAVWLAEEQARGRGRQGRTWSCRPHAGLLCSFVVRAPLDSTARPTLLPLAVGLGACEALRQASGAAVRTKWPNDLWLDGRKLGGVLVEAQGARGRAVVGIGINCDAAALDAADLPHAAAVPAGVRREALLAAVLAAIGARIEDWYAARFAPLHQAWAELDCVLGAHLRVETASEVLVGRAVAITAAGLLQLELDGGARRDVAAGEVHLA
jgi:BirA family biotin operon repressor/biotin-[acetyl-CoA-carboxylase] ligase